MKGFETKTNAQFAKVQEYSEIFFLISCLKQCFRLWKLYQSQTKCVIIPFNNSALLSFVLYWYKFSCRVTREKMDYYTQVYKMKGITDTVKFAVCIQTTEYPSKFL